MRVLIAEDNDLVRQLISMLMEKWGYDCDLARNGMEAVEMAIRRKGQYDIALFDIDMPVMKGSEAAQLIRQKYKSLPIMAVTGNLNFKHYYKHFGMNDFLAKPYHPSQLQQKIRKLVIAPLPDAPKSTVAQPAVRTDFGLRGPFQIR